MNDARTCHISQKMKQINMTQIFPSWADVAPNLIAVAAGREAADQVFQNCNLVNVQTREVLNGWQVAVAKGRFAYIGPNASHCIGDETDVFDVEGRYLVPGLCDGHMHIESIAFLSLTPINRK